MQEAVRNVRQNPGLICVRYVAASLWKMGYPEQALRQIQVALSMTQEMVHPPSQVSVLVFTARLHQHRREAPLTRTWAEVTITLAQQQGYAQRLAAGTILRRWARAVQGEVVAGLAELHQGVSAYRATGAVDNLPYWLVLLAEIYGQAKQAGGIARAVGGPGDRPNPWATRVGRGISMAPGELLLAQESYRQLATGCAKPKSLSSKRLPLPASSARSRLSCARP